MRIAASPVQQASLIRQAIWWRGDGHPAFTGMGQPPGYGKSRGNDRASGEDLGRAGLATSANLHPVIACDKREAFAQGSSDSDVVVSWVRRLFENGEVYYAVV